MRSSTLLILAATALVACGDDPPKTTSSAGSAAASGPGASAASSAPPAPTEAPGPAKMPELTVDAQGPYLNGARPDLSAAGGKEKLTKIVQALPIHGQAVTLLVDKKSKVAHVFAVIEELGKAGAPKILVKTSGRGDLPKEVTFTPASRVSNPPGCSISAMVLKDLSTAVWPFKGGLGKRHRKGFAGPDLTHTTEALKKDFKSCDSTMAFVGSDENVAWEDAFNLAGTILQADEKKRVDTLVLLPDDAVAGRAVTLPK